MEKVAKQMEQMQQESAEMESNLSIAELRQLLKNLLNTSFDQEKVMLNLKGMNSNDPLYTQNVQKQRSIKDNMKTIADSLFSLSKRVPQIETAVNEEMQKINFNIDKSTGKPWRKKHCHGKQESAVHHDVSKQPNLNAE
ncbi:hypothetical protein [Pedobacter panaciterrae]